MDPLSIIASTIAIAGAVGGTLEAVRRLCGAEETILSLINEVSDLRLILEEVANTIRERKQIISDLKADRMRTIACVLERAQTELEEVHKVIDNGIFKEEHINGRRKIGRLTWFRQKSKLQRLHSQLQLNKMSLLQDDYKTQLGLQTRYMENLVKDNERTPLAITSSEDDDCQTVASVDAPPSYSSAGLSSPQKDINRWQNTTQNSFLQIQVTRNAWTRCTEWCSCDCHRPQSVQLNGYSRHLIGSLFMSYNGLPMLSKKCSDKACQRKSSFALKFSYYFPNWIINRMIQVALWASSPDGLQCSLSTPRVVSDSADILRFACKGDLLGMKMLFEQRIASPFDVGDGTGRSPLHYAINYDHPEVAKFLIDCGASPHSQDQELVTPVALAWRRIFGSLSNSETAERYQCMFEDEEFLESRTFQPPHKIILGISDANLDQYLKLSPGDIDSVDADGRTALSWAAARGDVESVTTLLLSGADPNLKSHWSQTPLHWAAQCQRGYALQVIELLLENGASACEIDYWNRTALTYASGNHKDTAPIERLVQYGAGLDVRDRRLRTALGYAARLGNKDHVRFLIDSGANADLPDEFNVIPLLEAVKNNYHDILRLLIPVSSPGLTKPFGSSFLHWIAMYADQSTMEILRTAAPDDLFDCEELTLADANGLTPEGLFDQRTLVAEEEIMSFKTLIALIGDIENNEKQEFYDAYTDIV